jgi:glycosyltransferase involved in cell wall biosynthesis
MNIDSSAGGGGRPFRLVAYTDNTVLGGADLSLSHLLTFLGDEIRIAVLGVSQAIVERVAAGRADAATLVVPQPRHGHDWQSLIAHARAIQSFRPDVLHVNLSSPWSCQYAVAAAAVARRPGVVAVYQLPVPAVGARQRLTKRLTSMRIDRHVGVGERTSSEVEELLKLPRGSVLTIHNGVPDVSVDKPAARPRATAVIGAAGRLEPQKGFDVLLRALRDVEGAVLVLIGEGSEHEHLRSLARRLELSDRIVWHGWSDDVRSFLPSFDVFVLPSRFEGFPLVVLEALLAETAVVATDVGSVREAVRPGETGLLVPPDDPAALAAAIQRLLADAALRRRLATRARELVLERFTAEHMARSFHALYEELLP